MTAGELTDLVRIRITPVWELAGLIAKERNKYVGLVYTQVYRATMGAVECAVGKQANNGVGGAVLDSLCDPIEYSVYGDIRNRLLEHLVSLRFTVNPYDVLEQIHAQIKESG
jgi:hypothetical protein